MSDDQAPPPPAAPEMIFAIGIDPNTGQPAVVFNRPALEIIPLLERVIEKFRPKPEELILTGRRGTGGVKIFGTIPGINGVKVK